MNMWGSPSTAQQKSQPFDPATAFEEASADTEGDSDSNRSDDGWQDKQLAGNKRQRLDDTDKQNTIQPSAPEVTTAGSEASKDS